MQLAERRLHARLSLDLPCRLGGTTEARVRELSLGGALVVAPSEALRMGAECSLAIEVPGWPGPFSLRGRVVRRDVRGGETGATFGLRLDAGDDPGFRENLAAVLDLLTQTPGPGTRRHARLIWSAEVTCKSVREFSALLSNVSRGGLALTTTRRITIGETIAVEIRVRDQPPMTFPTKVVHVSEQEKSTWKVGVQFEPLDSATQARLDEFLRRTIRGR